MRISRIFRKYSRVLLLVFMSLLLVVFLVGDVISRAARSRSFKDVQIGTAFGEPVYQTQIQQADAELQLAAQVGAALPRISAKDEHERGLTFFLLMEEARRAGIQISRERIIQGFKNRPRASAVLDRVHKRGGRSLDSIYDILARVSAVNVMAEMQLSAAIDSSLPELEQAYRDRNQEARVQLSAIDSKAFVDNAPEPTAEELQAFFDEAKDRRTAHTEDELIFGYRLEDRVQIEYLTVDPSLIVSSVRVSAREAERYYRDNMTRYKKTIEEDPSFKLDKTAKPAQTQMTFEEAKDLVREDCRREKAVREAQSLVNLIREKAARPWLAAPIDDEGNRQTPSADEIQPFTALRDEFSSQYPVTYKKTELVSLADLRREQGFAQASASFDRRPTSAPDLAFRVDGLVEAAEGDRVPVLHLNEPSPVVIETRIAPGSTQQSAYQAYFFRVIRVEPSGPPASLDIVRPKVVADFKQTKAFEMAREQADKLSAKAREVGLEQAVAQAAELRALLGDTGATAEAEPPDTQKDSARFIRELGPSEPKNFRRVTRYVANVGRAPELVKKIFAMFDEKKDESTRQIGVFPVASSFKWVVVEPLEISPIYRGDFEAQENQLEIQAAQPIAYVFRQIWSSPENVIKRTGFVPKVRENKQATEEDKPAP